MATTKELNPCGEVEFYLDGDMVLNSDLLKLTGAPTHDSWHGL